MRRVGVGCLVLTVAFVVGVGGCWFYNHEREKAFDNVRVEMTEEQVAGLLGKPTYVFEPPNEIHTKGADAVCLKDLSKVVYYDARSRLPLTLYINSSRRVTCISTSFMHLQNVWH